MGARLLTGVFAAGTIPTTFVYIGDTVHYAHRQKVVARFASVFSAAQALSATIAGTVTHFVSWRVLFYAYAVLTLVTVGAMHDAPEAPRAPTWACSQATLRTELVPAARGKSFTLFALAFFVGGSVGTAVSAVWSTTG